MDYYQQQHYHQLIEEEKEEQQEHQFPLRRPQATMEDDSSAMQPRPSPNVTRRTTATFNSIPNSSHHSGNNQSSSFSSYPCPPPIEPLKEPSYQVQLLLGDMFSEQATLRNYCADSMQAFMMALDEQRVLERERQAEEEASLALILALQKEEVVQQQDDLLASQHSYSPQRHQPQPAQEVPTSSRRRRPSSAAETDPAVSSSSNHHVKATQRMSLMSDLTSDLGSIISEDSSLEIPDFFTTTEAVLSHMSLKGFQKEIMPIPLPPLLAGSSDEEKKLKAYAQHLSGGSNSSFSSSQDDHRRRRGIQQQQYHSSNLKVGYDSDETTKDGQLKKISDPYHSPNVRIERLTARGSVELMNPPPPDFFPNASYCQPVVPPAAAATAPPPTTNNRSSSSSSSNNHNKNKAKTQTNSNGKRKDRQCIICHRSTADCRLRMRKLRCGHQYCRSCIDRWLQSNDSCPYCRQKVSEKTRQKVRRQNSVGPTAA